MKRFTSLRLRDLVAGSGWVKLGLMMLIVAQTSLVKAQSSFSSPQVLTGDWGSVTNDNTGNIPDPGFLGIAGNFPYAPIWYQWTAPQDGDVELNTYGSSSEYTTYTFTPPDYIPVLVTVTNAADTVLGVYTGSSAAALTQVAANDDLYPFSNPVQENVVRGDLSSLFSGGIGQSLVDYEDIYISQPYGGPSGLHFNAKAGTTYYFAVDSKYLPGQMVLNYAFHPAGVFRFATEDFYQYENANYSTVSIPIYEASSTESIEPSYVVGRPATIQTYYPYNVPGVLVTVTRVAGSSGRMEVDYTVTNVAAAFPGVPLPGRDIPAVPATNGLVGDFTPVSGTLIFDDYEMSKTIMIPIDPYYYDNLIGSQTPDRDFAVVLSNPRPDPTESSDVSNPGLDVPFSAAMVRILDANTDPREALLSTNVVGGKKTAFTNTVVTSIDYQTLQNITTTITNVIDTTTNLVTNSIAFGY
ncbi:MAG TPA: hypothetical protein VMA13_04570, partial [Candidatus Saccharimonadales bacterium]|nr:hypothetical protein [Candidatus Saccharimonadales bacterium]